jgi:hypothetical protein
MLENINSLEDDVNCEALQVDEMADPDRPRISGTQSRMARGALFWDLDDKEKTRVSHMTMRRIERDDPTVTDAMHFLVRSAFEAAGIEFLGDDGVRDRRKELGIPIEPPAKKKPGKKAKTITGGADD